MRVVITTRIVQRRGSKAKRLKRKMTMKRRLLTECHVGWRCRSHESRRRVASQLIKMARERIGIILPEHVTQGAPRAQLRLKPLPTCSVIHTLLAALLKTLLPLDF